MEWKDLNISDKNIIDKFTKNRFIVSDYNFTNQLIWSKGENTKYKIVENTLLIKSIYDEKEYFYMPIPESFEDVTTWKNIIKNIVDNGGEIDLIPENYYELLKDDFLLEENRDSFDYLYNTEDLAYLKGRKYSKKKNKVNKFIKSYDFSYEKIGKDNISDVIEFQKRWYEMNRTPENEIILTNENKGIMEVLTNFEKLDVVGGIILVDRKIVAYTIGEVLQKDYALTHTEKALDEYTGSYQMINKLLCKNEFINIKYVNREDDFGKLGLREAKLSYNPCKLIKKYKIRRAL